MHTISPAPSRQIPLNKLTKNSLLLVIAPHAGMPLIYETAARLALKGGVRVLDGGNRFNVYPVAQSIRRLTPRLEETLARISLARAFTCYQMLTLLEETPALPMITLVLDLLSTYLDESVTLEESYRLLQQSLIQLDRLSQAAAVVISVKPFLALSANRTSLLELLEQSVSDVIKLESPRPSTASAPMLWPGEPDQ